MQKVGRIVAAWGLLALGGCGSAPTEVPQSREKPAVAVQTQAPPTPELPKPEPRIERPRTPPPPPPPPPPPSAEPAPRDPPLEPRKPDPAPVKPPEVEKKNIDQPKQPGKQPPDKAPDGPIGFANREESKRHELLSRGGGNPMSEAAVIRALEWLARVQNPATGAWSLTGKAEGARYSGGSERENESAATAMALLAFQGAGNTHTQGKFRANVAKGWEFLLKQQGADGCLTKIETRERFYTHGQCTVALCEIYGMTKDAKFQEPAQRAVAFCVKTQNRLGGWRYFAGDDGTSSDSDMSVTGWMASAFESARLAGLPTPPETLAGIGNFLDKTQSQGGSQYGYQAGGGPAETMTAEGLLCRQYLGWKQDDPQLTAGADYLLTRLPSWQDRNVYYWFYATQVMHHLEGARWTKWNSVMRDLLVAKQEKQDPEKGSWDPVKPTPDKWGFEGGRLYVTCLSTCILEAYYRHAPRYSAPAD